jgi:hypothetical protein
LHGKVRLKVLPLVSVQTQFRSIGNHDESLSAQAYGTKVGNILQALIAVTGRMSMNKHEEKDTLRNMTLSPIRDICSLPEAKHLALHCVENMSPPGSDL